MRRGRPKKPTISADSIEAALRTLGHRGSEVSEVLALQHLAIVEQYLENPSRPSAEDIRGWALRALLLQFVTDALSTQRIIFDLQAPSIHEKRQTALEHIQIDSQCNSSELLGWSILFYRYVRSDLEITVQEFADFVNVHPRTIRRERSDAILRLRDKLIEAEWQARQNNHLRILRASIPEQHQQLIERESEMASVVQAFEHRQIQHIFLSGAAGVGKSAFASAISHWLIEQKVLDHLVWLTKPENCNEVKNAVIDKLLPYQSQAEIAPVLLEYRTLVVLDDAEALIMNSDEWLDLLRFLNHAIVIICNREHVLFPRPVEHIPIRELSQFGIYELIASYGIHDNSIQEEIVRVVGGNPRAIDFAIRQLVLGNNIQFGDAALRALYDEVFHQLDDEQRLLWILLSTQKNAIQRADLSIMLTTEIKLFNHGLMDKLEDKQEIRLLPSAKTYLELQVKTDSNVRQFANRKLNEFLEQILEVSPEIVLDILTCKWLDFDRALVWDVLAKCDTSSMILPQLRRWWDILANDELIPLRCLLSKGIAARRLHKYDEAFSILNYIVEVTGRDGDFDLQAMSRYELAVLYQARSEFDRADAIYQDLETYRLINRDKLFAHKIRRQQARMAISTRNAEHTLRYLEGLETTIEDGILLCEAYLIQNESALCREKAHEYLAYISGKHGLIASLYTIIGRSYEMEAVLEKALEYFTAALAVSERFNSRLDIARAQSNLASIYIQLADRDLINQAEELLRQALHTQKLIGDYVGLLVTERNLQQLQILRLQRHD